MSQKLTLAVYLEQKGQKAKALKRVEAEAFGIPYPLQAGWPGRHGDMEVTPQMLEHIATTRARGRPPAPAPQGDEGHQNPRPSGDIKQASRTDLLHAPRFPGFAIRPARRYRVRYFVPTT
jgi:hypothetical protein